MKLLDKEVINLYLTENVSCRELAKKFGVVHGTISSLLKRNGIDSSKRNKFPVCKKQWGYIRDLYKSGKHTGEIARLFNVRDSNIILRILKKQKCQVRTKSEVSRKNFINESFFDEINGEKKAYILGFLYADGYNTDKGFSIGLNMKDIDVLEKIKKEMEYTGPIRSYPQTNSILLDSHSFHLSKRLTELGCFRAKSLTLKFPTFEQVPEYLLFHFLRGYSDGDGCLAITKKGYPNWSVVGSIDFITSLRKILIKKFSIKGYFRIKRKCAELIIGGGKEAKLILDWLYKDATIYLDRKYQKYLEIKSKNG